ncbi:MAG: hypothetical protein H0W25_00025 [Acidimicrobiia bacterium]|nr:hypothetical protein [Acidimicrobiia bacterium]
MPAPSTVTLILVAVLVLALAGYLSVIAYLLHKASFTLGTVLIGVRSIEYQTRPLGDVVGGIGGDIVAIEGALRGLRPAEEPTDSQAASG